MKNFTYGIQGILIMIILSFQAPVIWAQEPVNNPPGVEVIIQDQREKVLNNYFFIHAGYQNPYWVTVPMVPETIKPENFREGEQLETLASGYFLGAGIMNKTQKFLEVGLMGDYYYSTAALTRSGQRSMGPWVRLQTTDNSYYTDPFDTDHNRVSEIIIIRATARLKLPLGPVNLWAGIAAGTYTSTLRLTNREDMSIFNSARATLVAPSYQGGIDILFKDSQKRERVSITFFAEFHSPTMEENFYDTVIEGWSFYLPDGNKVISPFRTGVSLGIHI